MLKNRRDFIGKSAMGIFGLFPILSHARHEDLTAISGQSNQAFNSEPVTLSASYPSTDPALVQRVVGAAHTEFDVVKELVTNQPELAKATHDWGFGDVETALGAASHMGRKDIAEFLIEYGARPDIFAFAMLGKFAAVKAMIEEMPGIQKIHGPHGLTLMHHATMRIRRKNVEGTEKEMQEALVEYLMSLGDADIKATALEITDEERNKYLGKYVFGDGEEDYFNVTINGMNNLALSRAEYTGRNLLRIDTNTFAPGGAPSVKIEFSVKEGQALSLTIHDPVPIVTAIRI
jgi:hypothetical protein